MGSQKTEGSSHFSPPMGKAGFYVYSVLMVAFFLQQAIKISSKFLKEEARLSIIFLL